MIEEYFKLMNDRPELFQSSDSDDFLRIITDPIEIKKLSGQLKTEVGILYKDKYIILVKDLVIFPNTNIGTYIRIIPGIGNGGVVVLPFLKDRIVMLKHFRHSTRKSYLELPRGFAELSLSNEDNAIKEVLEETRYHVDSIEYLGTIAPDTGLLATQAVVYKALLAPEKDNEEIDQNESIQKIECFTINEIKEMVVNGQIQDGYTDLNNTLDTIGTYGDVLINEAYAKPVTQI